MSRRPVACRSCGEPIAWHVSGDDEYQQRDAEWYIGTVFPAAVRRQGDSPDGRPRFGVPDRVRQQHRSPRSGGQDPLIVEAARLVNREPIRRALGRTKTSTRFRGVVVYGPAFVWCSACGTGQDIEPPADLLVEEVDPLADLPW